LYQAFVVPLLLINNDNDGQYRCVFICIFFVISAAVDVAEQQITPSLFNQHSFLDSLRVGMGPPEKKYYGILSPNNSVKPFTGNFQSSK